MAKDKAIIFWSAGGLAAVVLAASAWAQQPVPPTGPYGYPIAPPPGPGPVARAANHTWAVLQDNFVGYPSEFIEPPVGFYVHENYAMMRAKANIHRFTLYRSDFLDGTSRFSPNGASRFNIMAKRLRGWLGPVVIEWSPDQPGLAEARRTAIVSLLQGSGLNVIPERVVIGPSPYPGELGQDAAQNFPIMISRDAQAPTSYSVTPTAGAGFAGGTP
jgi:hypothetical protein